MAHCLPSRKKIAPGFKSGFSTGSMKEFNFRDSYT
jgi:hypothetical protein